MILSYQTLQSMKSVSILDPFIDRTVHKSGLSGGISHSGYDIHIKQEIILYPISLKNLILNALGFERPFYALASSVEHFNIPDYLACFITDKSTLARMGLSVFNTFCESGWKGWLTLELKNSGPNIIHLQAGQPIAQAIFVKLDFPTNSPYKGKYQNQISDPQKALLEK